MEDLKHDISLAFCDLCHTLFGRRIEDGESFNQGGFEFHFVYDSYEEGSYKYNCLAKKDGKLLMEFDVVFDVDNSDRIEYVFRDKEVENHDN